MRKLLTVVSALFITGSMFAGGLVTNTNQSATWVRQPARNASTSIDAAYYNPAGLMKLENGFHVSLSNQSIWQTRDINNDYAGPGGAYGLNEHAYKGTATAPLFPSIYAVYKMDKLALSFGFNPVGGGGAATYEKGLPSFEMSASDLVPGLASLGASAYQLDAYLEGKSIFFGFQGALSYKINDMFAVAAGARYVSAKNTYNGHLQNIQVNLANATAIGLTNGWNRADAVMAKIAGNYKTASLSASQMVAGGLGAQTFATAKALGVITATQQAQLEGLLTSAGYPANTPIAQADQVYDGAYIKYRANSKLLADQTADVEQTGSGVAPFLSINISPNENLNIAVKYEFATKLDLKNNTNGDFLVGFENYPSSTIPDTTKMITMFPDGGMTRNDMPALLTVGIDYKISSALKLSLGMNYYFDKPADYGHKIDDDLKSSTPSVHIPNSDIIDNNGLSISGGLEYNISEKFLVSGGYSWANQGVNEKYQSDLTYGLGTSTVGAGAAYKITEKIQLNLGGSYTKYREGSKTVDHILSGTTTDITSNEIYNKTTFMFGIGLDMRF